MVLIGPMTRGNVKKPSTAFEKPNTTDSAFKKPSTTLKKPNITSSALKKPSATSSAPKKPNTTGSAFEVSSKAPTIIFDEKKYGLSGKGEGRSHQKLNSKGTTANDTADQVVSADEADE